MYASADLPVIFPVRSFNFPALQNIFPVNWSSELREKPLRHSDFWFQQSVRKPPNRKIPCKIPCSQGIPVETGAISTASPAKQSCVQPGSPTDARIGRKSRLFAIQVCLWTPGSPDMRRKSPKVSGLVCEYSRFADTTGGDKFDHDCRPSLAEIEGEREMIGQALMG
jgi:hypothetical protein